MEEHKELPLMKTPEEFAKTSPYMKEAAIEKKTLSEVYEDIKGLINYYMDMPDDQVRIVATWIIGTYFHKEFNTFPFLFVNAMRGSGKTRLLRLISYLSYKGSGQVQTGLSESGLFRMDEGQTLILDELESIAGKEKGIFREYLNACYKAGGCVTRSKKTRTKEGEEYVNEKLNNLAKTKKVEDFEYNDTIKICKRALEGLSAVSVVSLPKKQLTTAWNNFIDLKYNSTTTHITYTTLTTLTTLQQELFEKIDGIGIDGRNFELLFPLLLVSNMIGPEHFEGMLSIGKAIMDIKKGEEFAESADVSFYQFVAIQPAQLNYTPIKELTYKFKTYRGEEDWINEKWVGRALKRLNLSIDSKRVASGRLVMLNVAKASEKCKIFSPQEGKNETNNN